MSVGAGGKWVAGAGLAWALAFACGDESASPADGASSGGTVSSSGGVASGGAATGGATTGGTATGGVQSSGGVSAAAGQPSAGSSAEAGASPGAGGAAGATGSAGAPGTLDFYFVDVEGGAATVIVTPEGEVILVDAGSAGGRDALRVEEVLLGEIGTNTIQHLILTHYHNDHGGGVPQIADHFTVENFYDHGANIETSPGATRDTYDAYLAALAAETGSTRTIVTPGTTLELGDVTLSFVASHGATITSALGTAVPNPFCGAAPNTSDNENHMSVSFILSYGIFDFLDFGDLTTEVEHKLVCPDNLLGEVDLYQTTHHGLAQSNLDDLTQAVNPIAAVTNNSDVKGNEPAAYDAVHLATALLGYWQLHTRTGNDSDHNADVALTANIVSGEPNHSPAHYVRARVNADGSFVVENTSNGFSETYQAR